LAVVQHTFTHKQHTVRHKRKTIYRTTQKFRKTQHLVLTIRSLQRSHEKQPMVADVSNPSADTKQLVVTSAVPTIPPRDKPPLNSNTSNYT